MCPTCLQPFPDLWFLVFLWALAWCEYHRFACSPSVLQMFRDSVLDLPRRR